MNAKTIVENTATLATMELMNAQLDLTAALDHLQDLMGRVRRDVEAGQFYNETNLAKAVAEVTALNARCSAKKELKGYADYMLENMTAE